MPEVSSSSLSCSVPVIMGFEPNLWWAYAARNISVTANNNTILRFLKVPSGILFKTDANLRNPDEVCIKLALR